MRKIFITGGTGFFGKSLLRHWRSEQNKSEKPDLLTILSRCPQKFIDANPRLSLGGGIRFHLGDISKPSTLPLDDVHDGVIHAATDSTNSETLSPLMRFDQIVIGTRNLLDYSVSSGVRRFLLTSSGAVYGQLPMTSIPVSEDYSGSPDPLITANAYGMGKLSAEHLCAMYAENYGIEIIVARCFTFVGEDLPLNAHYAIGNFIKDALWSNEIVVKGDGRSIRSYLDQRDLAEWLSTLLDKGSSGEAYNVGSDQEISILDLAHLVRDIVSPKKTVRIAGNAEGNKLRSRYVPNIEKIKNELGLRQTIPLEKSIQNTAERIANLND
jgi:UDP-glucuronate decarboxylase